MAWGSTRGTGKEVKKEEQDMTREIYVERMQF